MANFCSQCGAKSMPQDNFCTSCGAGLSHNRVGVHNKGAYSKAELAGDRRSVQKIVSLNKAVVLGFKRYADFKGRSSRSEYWFFILFQLIIYGFIGILVVLLESSHSLGSITTESYNYLNLLVFSLASLFWLGTFIPTLAVAVRRLHDASYSAWYLFLYLIPYVGPMVLVAFYMLRSVEGENEYGTMPNIAR